MASSARGRGSPRDLTAHDADARLRDDNLDARRQQRERQRAPQSRLWIAVTRRRNANSAAKAIGRGGVPPFRPRSCDLYRGEGDARADALDPASAQIPIGGFGAPRFSAIEFLRRLAIVRGSRKISSSAS
jgi:hypothetical protein